MKASRTAIARTAEPAAGRVSWFVAWSADARNERGSVESRSDDCLSSYEDRLADTDFCRAGCSRGRDTRNVIRRSVPLRRSPLRRGPGRKAKREAAAWELCKAIVRARSGGLCEGPEAARRAGAKMWVGDRCTSYPHAARAIHHLWPEDRDRGRHEPDRCLHLCDEAHHFAHTRVSEAMALGLLRPGKVSGHDSMPDSDV